MILDFYKFLKDHLNDDLYCLMETDTDSLYLALARESIDECVRTDRLDSWWAKKHEYFTSDSEQIIEFKGHQMTKKAYDKRSRGLFKLEFEGECMIALNSKVYFICGVKDGKHYQKCSSKGMQDRNELTKQEFLDVLFNNLNHFIINSGFIDNGLVKSTYTQRKRGLSYFYGKRKVSPDHVTTTHLDI